MIIDTSFLFSFLFAEDALHEKAVVDAEKSKGEAWIVPDRILEELFSIAVCKIGLDEAIGAIEKLEKNANVSVYYFEKEEVKRIFGMAKERRKKLSFADCSVIYLAGVSGERIMACDRQLVAAAKKDFSN